MKFIKNIVRRVVNWSQTEELSEDPKMPFPGVFPSVNRIRGSSSNASKSQDFEFPISGINFTIYPASGGKVVRVHHYDHVKDRSDNNLYIIQDSDDFGQELAMILARHRLAT
jgi:hypothetical protein